MWRDEGIQIPSSAGGCSFLYLLWESLSSPGTVLSLYTNPTDRKCEGVSLGLFPSTRLSVLKPVPTVLIALVSLNPASESPPPLFLSTCDTRLFWTPCISI